MLLNDAILAGGDRGVERQWGQDKPRGRTLDPRRAASLIAPAAWKTSCEGQHH